MTKRKQSLVEYVRDWMARAEHDDPLPIEVEVEVGGRVSVVARIGDKERTCDCGKRQPEFWLHKVAIELKRLRNHRRAKEWEDAMMKAVANGDHLKLVDARKAHEAARKDRKAREKKAEQDRLRAALNAEMNILPPIVKGRSFDFDIEGDIEGRYADADPEEGGEIEEAANILLRRLPEFEARDDGLALVLFDAYRKGRCLLCPELIEEAKQSPEIWRSLDALRNTLEKEGAQLPPALRDDFPEKPPESGQGPGHLHHTFRDAHFVHVMAFLATLTGLKVTRNAARTEGTVSICSIMARTKAAKDANISEGALERVWAARKFDAESAPWKITFEEEDRRQRRRGRRKPAVTP